MFPSKMLLLFCGVICSHAIKQFEDCSYHDNSVYNISSSQTIFEAMNISYPSIDIQFDIKLHQYCDDIQCNIICLGNSLALSINGINDYFEISKLYLFNTSIYYQYQIDTIPNATMLLPVDNNYHKIYISYSYESSFYADYILNSFQIDDFATYYYAWEDYPYALSQNFYASCPISMGLNASISNICVNTPINIDNIQIFENEISCGDTIQSSLDSTYDIDYYYFDLTATSAVLFDSCGSSFNTSLALYDMEFIEIGTSAVRYDCFPQSQLIFQPLFKDKYVLKISGSGFANEYDIYHDYGEYQLKVICVIDDNINVTKANNYHKNVNSTNNYILSGPVMDLYQAERECELMYGTSLATIITDNDIIEAVKVINETVHKYINLDIVGYDNICAWIGLYLDMSNQKWQWVDGITCNYTKSGDCIDDVHWQQNKSDHIPVPNSLWNIVPQFAAALCIPNLREGDVDPSFVPRHFAISSSFDEYPLFLCNRFGSKYKVKHCMEQSCWRQMYEFDDAIMQIDFTRNSWTVFNGNDFYPAIAYWNLKLFIIGINKIHYTNINIFDNERMWQHHIYNPEDRPYWTNTQLYAQYQSMLYIYGTLYNPIHGYTGVIVELNLESLQVEYQYMDFEENVGFTISTKCIVSGYKSLYLIRKTEILIYSKDTKTVNSVQFNNQIPNKLADGEPIKCVINDDEDIIYIFGSTYFFSPFQALFIYIKYNITSGIIIKTNTSALCLAKVKSHAISTVIGKNGKVYFHGCHIAGWKTMVFDTKYDKFSMETISIQNPIYYDMHYYKSAQLTAVGDNALMLFHENENGYSLYSTITDLISINFKNIDIFDKIWPSDGFVLQYYLNDFNFDENNIYQIWLYSTDTENSINVTITLNTTNDSCICTESIYNCNDCTQQFPLHDYLSVMDNNIDELTFILIAQNDILVLPEYIFMELTRCEILFKDINVTTTNID
eukprot:394187_1